MGSKKNQKNVQERSVIFAPFNSTANSDNRPSEDDPQYHPLFDSVDFQQLFVKHARRVIRFGAKCSDVNRQYEKNNNAELDNGIINECMLQQDHSSEFSIMEENKKRSLIIEDDKNEGSDVSNPKTFNLQLEMETETIATVAQKVESKQLFFSIINQISENSCFPRDFLLKQLYPEGIVPVGKYVTEKKRTGN